MLRAIYSLLMLLALPVIVLRLYWRGRKEPRYREHIGERFGQFGQPAAQGAVWLHAVSVGEMRAAEPLVAALRAKHPDAPLLLTCMTPTGRATAQQLYGAIATITYLPYDIGFLVRRLIARFSPRVFIFMETELWPNAIAACHAARIPAFLVNARLSEKSFRNYQRVTPVHALIRQALAQLTGVAAQHARDAERLAALGAASPVVTGSLKFDVDVDETLATLGLSWRNALAPQRSVILAVSTRDGEERAIADAYAVAFSKEERSRQLLVVVPRHPPRFNEAADLITAAGLTIQRRSSGEAIDSNTEVWLGDSMGEVAAYVAMCDFAFVGGSLLPLGGQNLIEVCAQGKPVIMGPSTYNFADAARAAAEAGAMIPATDASDVMHKAKHLLKDTSVRERGAAAAREFSLRHRGATQKTLLLIAPSLDAR